MANTIKKVKLIFKTTVGFLLAVAILTVFKSGGYVNSTTITPTPSIAYDGCSNHGGVNCSILNPDALVVCNDGTVNESSIIYAVPQCQKIIEQINSQRSDFMAKSGCVPPGEMACTNEQSYKNLSENITASKLANSELGKDELVQCRQQIKDYQTKNKDYKQCLLKNNNPQFSLPTNQLVQPILKAVFCPIFYGNNSSYDSDADLCICDSGYFLSNKKCVEASLICQFKYGPRAYAENGNCLVSQNLTTLKPVVSTTPRAKKSLPVLSYPTSYPTPIAPILSALPATPLDTPRVAPFYSSELYPTASTQKAPVKEASSIKIMTSLFASFVKRLLKLP